MREVYRKVLQAKRRRYQSSDDGMWSTHIFPAYHTHDLRTLDAAYRESFLEFGLLHGDSLHRHESDCEVF